jgi:2-isopropylmalate synthase
VLIENGFGDERWTTVGASSDVIEASWLALVDGIEYGLAIARDGANRMRVLET